MGRGSGICNRQERTADDNGGIGQQVERSSVHLSSEIDAFWRSEQGMIPKGKDLGGRNRRGKSWDYLGDHLLRGWRGQGVKECFGK